MPSASACQAVLAGGVRTLTICAADKNRSKLCRFRQITAFSTYHALTCRTTHTCRTTIQRTSYNAHLSCNAHLSYKRATHICHTNAHLSCNVRRPSRHTELLYQSKRKCRQAMNPSHAPILSVGLQADKTGIARIHRIVIVSHCDCLGCCGGPAGCHRLCSRSAGSAAGTAGTSTSTGSA
jgi:hypothetical protein